MQAFKTLDTKDVDVPYAVTLAGWILLMATIDKKDVAEERADQQANPTEMIKPADERNPSAVYKMSCILRNASRTSNPSLCTQG